MKFARCFYVLYTNYAIKTKKGFYGRLVKYLKCTPMSNSCVIVGLC